MEDKNVNIIFVLVLNVIIFCITYCAACFLAKRYISRQYKKPPRYKKMPKSKELQVYKCTMDQMIIQNYKYEKYNRRYILEQLVEYRSEAVHKMNYYENNIILKSKFFLLCQSLRERMFDIITIFFIEYCQKNNLETEFPKIFGLIEHGDRFMFYEDSAKALVKSELLIMYILYFYRLIIKMCEYEMKKEPRESYYLEIIELHDKFKMTIDSFHIVYNRNLKEFHPDFPELYYDYFDEFENIILEFFDIFDENEI